MFLQNILSTSVTYDEFVWPNNYTGDGGFFSVLSFKNRNEADNFRTNYHFDDDHSVQLWSHVIIMALEEQELELILSTIADEYGGSVIQEDMHKAYSLLIGSC